MKWLKKRKSAVALKYDREKAPAPVITASGRGKTAEKIIEIAKKNGIPIMEEPEIIDALLRINVGQMIPVELYRVIAEILAWIYRQDGRLK